MVTTLAADGKLTSRPVATTRLRFDGTLWFVVQRASPLAVEVEASPGVLVTFASPREKRHVAFSGEADVVEDADRLARAWTPGMDVWFPQGPTDPSLALLRIRVRTVEHWESPGNVPEDLLARVRAATKGKKYTGKEHELLELG